MKNFNSHLLIWVSSVTAPLSPDQLQKHNFNIFSRSSMDRYSDTAARRLYLHTTSWAWIQNDHMSDLVTLTPSTWDAMHVPAPPSQLLAWCYLLLGCSSITSTCTYQGCTYPHFFLFSTFAEYKHLREFVHQFNWFDFNNACSSPPLFFCF